MDIIVTQSQICRSILSLSRDFLFLPLYLGRAVLQELSDFLKRWRRFAAEYEQRFKQSQTKLESKLQNEQSPSTEAAPGAPETYEHCL